jgi:FkbM family methyltransferase
MIARVKTWSHAVRVARRHVVNWLKLVSKYLSGSSGLFQARAGGALTCDARMLLKQLVRLENAWRHCGDTLPTVRFEDNSIVIPNYFGRDFAIPLKAEGVAPPSAWLKVYPFDVKGDTVLDIGAYLGDTPLLWLYKGAARVIAVEPVPLHFRYLEKNTAGLPVVCLNASLAAPLQLSPAFEGSIKYGLWDEVKGSMLDVPVVQLNDLVKTYKPSVVKLNCEGCEHYVLEQLSQIPKLGVKKLAVRFHEIKGYKPYDSLAILEGKLGKSVKIEEKDTISITGRSVKVVSVYWLL